MSIRTVSCTFMGTDKAYTYLSKDPDIKKGDLCLVESNKPSERIIALSDGTVRPIRILSIVQVKDLDVPIKDNIEYKYIIDKINGWDEYFANKENK